MRSSLFKIDVFPSQRSDFSSSAASVSHHYDKGVPVRSLILHVLEHNFVMSRMAADSTYGGEDLRKTIDYFCHILRDSGFLKDLEEIDPEYYSKHGKEIGWATKLSNPVFNPTYGDMIRSTFMYKYDRAKMSDLVNLLSGRNFETKTYEEDVVEDSFRRMNEGVSRFVNGYNYRDFLSCIMATGFRDSDQITSSMTADFAYALYLRLIDLV